MKIKFEPRDLWIGLYWDRYECPGTEERWIRYYVCLIPCIVIILDGLKTRKRNPYTIECQYLPMPEEFALRHDMAIGPCKCGATHFISDWPPEACRVLFRKYPNYFLNIPEGIKEEMMRPIEE